MTIHSSIMHTPRTKTTTFLPTPDSTGHRLRNGKTLEREPSPTPCATDYRGNKRYDGKATGKRAMISLAPAKLFVGAYEEPKEDRTTLKSAPRKRKSAPGTRNGESPGKRAKGDTSLSGKDTTSEVYLEGVDAYNQPEQPVTPTLRQTESAVYQTPFSLDHKLPDKRPVPVVTAPKPISPLDFDNFDNERSDPSWDSYPSSGSETGIEELPKSRKSSRNLTRTRDDELYLPSPKTANRTFSKRRRLSCVDDGSSDENDEEYIDTGFVSRNETRDVVFDFSLERAKRWAAAVSLPEDTWCEAERELFFRLVMRGFEPLLPRHWKLDFSTLPDTLFSGPSDEGKPPICAVRESDFHAIKSLANLFALGGHVRDCSILRSKPELKIKRAIKRYIHWALKDADLHTTSSAIPLHTIHAQKKGESIVKAVSKANRRLCKLRKRYHDAFGVSTAVEQPIPVLQSPNINASPKLARPKDQFPLLVGFVVCGPIVAILTQDTDPLSPKGVGLGKETGCKFISQFDVGEKGQDVWTSLAIAITTMHIRRTMIQLADNGEGGFCRLRGGVRSGKDDDF